MRPLLILCAMFCTLGATYAQTSITGRVIDLESGIPIPYATVFSTADGSGTVTNAEGSFVLHLPAAGTPVRISCLGFDPVEKNLSDGETVSLVPARIEIETVVVTPLDVEDILKNIQKNYAANTSPDPIRYYANIRQFQIFDGEYIQGIDMIGDVAIPGNKSLGKTSKYKITAINASLFKDGTKENFEYSIKPILEANHVPLTIVRYMRKFINNFKFEITRLHQDGETLYAINYDNSANDPRNSYRGTLYVDTSNYAIVGIKFAQGKSSFAPKPFEYNGNRETFRWNAAEMEAGFMKVDGVYRASYMLARDSFWIGGRLASINYSFVYSSSKEIQPSERYTLFLDGDLYSQLESSSLGGNTDFNTLLPTAEERQFFNRK